MYKKIIAIGAFFPGFALAQVFGISDVLDSAIEFVSALIPFFLSLAVLVFFWGIVKFIAHNDDERARAEGKQVMIWGMVAIFVMVSMWSLVGYIQESLGLNTFSVLGASPALPTTLP